MSKNGGSQNTIEWYNENSDMYIQSSTKTYSLDQIDKFVSLLSPHGKKVLDAGCAWGRDASLLTNKGLDVTGIDLSDKLIHIAKKRFPNITFIQGNFLHLPFEDNTFNGVWAHASLLHLETVDDIEKALAEFYRVLKVNGILHIMVRQQLGKEKFAKEVDTQSQYYKFYQFFTPDELQKLLTENKFRIIQLLDNLDDVSGRTTVRWIWILARK